GGLPTAGTTTLVVSTVVAAPIAPVVLVLSQLFRVYTEPVSDWQVGGYVLGVGIGLVGFLIALWGLARIAADTKAQNAYARTAGLLAPTGPHVPPSGYPPAPPGGYPTRPPGY
ncbi:MAG: hypothetical protein GXX86_08615, partial [Propionibacterium sp.]|nr:hypothetical protein [Propionibacterium sp.]